jgi:hypothetical protein
MLPIVGNADPLRVWAKILSVRKTNVNARIVNFFIEVLFL